MSFAPISTKLPKKNQGKPPGSAKDWWKRPIIYTSATAVVCLCIGGLIGSGIGSSTRQPEVDDLRGLLEDSKESNSDLIDENWKLRSENGELANAAAERETELDKREAALDERETKISAAEAQQAANQFGGGVQTVGTTITAGVYTANVTSGLCYYAWKTGTGAAADIIDNNIVESGPATVTLEDGQIFESRGCGTWKRQ